MQEAYKEIGFKGLFKGTKARLLHVGVIVVSQLLVYDIIKASLGLQVTGSH